MLLCDLYSMALSLAISAGERLGTCEATPKTSTAERMTVRVTDSESLRLVKKEGVKRSGMSLMDLKKTGKLGCGTISTETSLGVTYTTFSQLRHLSGPG